MHVARRALVPVLHRFEHDARRSVAQLPLRNVPVFDGDDGVVRIGAPEIVYHDLAVFAKLVLDKDIRNFLKK